MLLDRAVYGRLEDGRYEVKLIDFKEEDGKDNKDNYLSIKLKFDNGRELKDTWFTGSIDIKANQLHQQLDLDDTATLAGVLQNAKTKSSITIWVSHAQVNGKTYRNINYSAPTYTPSSPASDVPTDDDF